MVWEAILYRHLCRKLTSLGEKSVKSQSVDKLVELNIVSINLLFAKIYPET